MYTNKNMNNKMALEYNIQTKFLLDPEINHTIQEKFDHCCKIINEKRHDQLFYVGISSDPETRTDVHIKEKGLSFMYVLCVASDKYETEILEKELIKKFKSQYMINKGTGGEGIQNSKNFIYVMV